MWTIIYIKHSKMEDLEGNYPWTCVIPLQVASGGASGASGTRAKATREEHLMCSWEMQLGADDSYLLQ